MSSNFKAKDLKSMNFYIEKYNLRLTLCIYPHTITFIDKATGEKITRTMDAINSEYNIWNKEDQKQRAVERKREADIEKSKGSRVKV